MYTPAPFYHSVVLNQFHIVCLFMLSSSLGSIRADKRYSQVAQQGTIALRGRGGGRAFHAAACPGPYGVSAAPRSLHLTQSSSPGSTQPARQQGEKPSEGFWSCAQEQAVCCRSAGSISAGTRLSAPNGARKLPPVCRRRHGAAACALPPKHASLPCDCRHSFTSADTSVAAKPQCLHLTAGGGGSAEWQRAAGYRGRGASC